ncbi:MAG: ADP-heptose:LPS heptosyltransferase [Crocinitomix sp.]|jgi:ADP-heptose:LPS heptosyltransferase
MKMRDKQSHIKARKYRFKVWGGLGDGIIMTIVLKELRRKEPDAKIIVRGKKRFQGLYLNNPSIDKFTILDWRTIPFDFFRVVFKFDKSIYLDGDPDSTVFRADRHIHTRKIMAQQLGIELRDRSAEVIIVQEEDQWAKEKLSQYESPVIIQITSRSSSNQNWPIENWNELIKKMPHINFIQIGIENEDVVKGAINFLGKTTIRESMALLKNAPTFISVDSFINNASNAFNTFGVVLFGPSSPKNWGYVKNTNLYQKTSCSPCMTVLGGNVCPYGSECMQNISVDHVKTALDSILSGLNK